MKKIVIFIQILCCILFGSKDLYTDDYFFMDTQNKSELISCETQKLVDKNETNYMLEYKTNVIVSNKKEQKISSPNKKNNKKVVTDKCDIVKAMANKTYYNQTKNIFYINNVEYKELPKEFKDCGILFNTLNRNGKELFFGLDDNKTIVGTIAIPDNQLDENFFYVFHKKEFSNKPTEKLSSLAQCDFTIPYGIRTAIDDNGNFIHLPKTYINQIPKLYFENTADGVYVSNNGFARIKITHTNFTKNCKVEQ